MKYQIDLEWILVCCNEMKQISEQPDMSADTPEGQNTQRGMEAEVWDVKGHE